MRSVWWMLVALCLAGTGCALDLTQAPCASDDNCPAGQFCDKAGICLAGGPPADRLDAITVESARRVLARGEPEQLTVKGTRRDGSSADLSARATWSSLSPSVATTSETGKVTALSEGTVRIRATVDGLVAELELTVIGAKLTSLVIKDTAEGPIPKGRLRQLAAVGTYTDGSTLELTSLVSWSSSTPTVASVSATTGSKGLVTANALGSATIRAEYGGVTGAFVVTVVAPELTRLDISPTSPVVARGTTRQLVAVGIFSDATTADLTSLVTWSVSDVSVATISNVSGSRGLLTSLAAGTTQLQAALQGITASTPATVTPATLDVLSVTPPSSSIAASTTAQLTATGIFSDNSTQDLTSQVLWSSSNASVATVSNSPGSHGAATGVAGGSATVTAGFNGRTGSATLTVSDAVLTSLAITPSPISLAVGVTKQLVAIGTFSNSSTQDLTSSAIWSSSNASVAAVSTSTGTKGKTEGRSAGSATISATVSGISGSASAQVSPATLTALTVTPANDVQIKGTSKQYVATGSYSDGSSLDVTNSVAWSSSSASVATVSNASGTKGLVSAVGAGPTTVSALLDGVTGGTGLTVTAPTLVSIAVSPANSSVAKGTQRQLIATGTYSDSSSQVLTDSVTWSSSNAAVAGVSNAAGSQGLLSGLEVGTATVSATFSGVTGNTSVNITAAVLTALSISPTDPVIFLFATQPFTATGTYSDGSTQTLTSAVVWTSSNTGVATISNAGTSKGQASGAAVGTTTITATMSGWTAQTTLRVQ